MLPLEADLPTRMLRFPVDLHAVWGWLLTRGFLADYILEEYPRDVHEEGW